MSLLLHCGPESLENIIETMSHLECPVLYLPRSTTVNAIKRWQSELYCDESCEYCNAHACTGHYLLVGTLGFRFTTVICLDTNDYAVVADLGPTSCGKKVLVFDISSWFTPL